ncbi:hypothetical protein LMG26788_03728 [Achromobacter pulmonis]|uniref:Uncharacterized protein n=1 Tax=Achromobacter pulmonis TaxID=1389932 RepID=A0A6S7DYJ3_9BURK|nr:hypothetical protein [Achromobacter pulmonis]CAB3888752.1 hypothetical protein LMG26788_03662 [Achromobacter pulmonis]CAB3890049.1 hypothetical protein LMG26788_03728 [Achromobacter pulmonis]
MTPEQLEAIATRQTHCRPFGEAVTISRAERDALVAMARRYAWLRDESAGVPDGMRQIIAVQLPLPHTEDADIDLFDEALDAAIDAAMAKEQ